MLVLVVLENCPSRQLDNLTVTPIRHGDNLSNGIVKIQVGKEFMPKQRMKTMNLSSGYERFKTRRFQHKLRSNILYSFFKEIRSKLHHREYTE